MSNYEAELLRKAREGDPNSAQELFVRYLKEARPIAGLLRRSLPNAEDREDMLHEIYLQLISGKNTFRGDARLSTYVYQVARITIFQKFRRENTLKRGRIYRAITEEVDIAGPNRYRPDYSYSIKEGRQILEELIQSLPAAYREALRLRVLEDKSYEEIAEELKLPINTVSSKIHKGKNLLSKILEARGVTEVFDI
jgi:RNA polymerase sigma-70 factor (ECF subfamily)